MTMTMTNDHDHDQYSNVMRASQLTEIMLTSNYMGIAVTYESITCGQTAGIVGTDKHCKVSFPSIS